VSSRRLHPAPPSPSRETANGTDSSAPFTAPLSPLRPTVAAFATLAVAVAVAASLYVLNNAAEAPEANAVVRAIMALTALVVGLYLWQRQPQNLFGPALAGGVLLLSPMALAVSEDPWTFTVGRTLAALAIVYAVGLVLLFPEGRLEGREPRRLLAAAAVGSGVLWIAALLFADTLPAGGPLIPCVGGCPDNAAQVVETDPDLSQVLGLAYGVFCAGIGLAGAALLVRRLRDATPIRRRAIIPVLAILPAVFVGMGAYVLMREAAPDSPLLDPIGWLVLGAFALFPSLVYLGLIRGRVLAASALEELVERLSRESSPVELQEAMKTALRDPALELVFWSARTQCYVDARGRDVYLPRGDRRWKLSKVAMGYAGRSVTRVDRDDRPVAAIVHDAELDSQPQLIQAVASATLMALENTTLQADLQAAVFDERRRIARDLHDGLAQDLAFISLQGQELAEKDPRADAIVTAAGQALAHARRAIVALSDPADESLPTAVARVATSLTDRSGTGLELELDDQAETGPRARDELLLIVSEAISNATRHGNASKIHVALSANAGLRLAISDDGCGFDNGASTSKNDTGGFGLTSMHERVDGLGGELHLHSRPGEGTQVEVMLP
jgi:signal transduction histidine kinase